MKTNSEQENIEKIRTKEAMFGFHECARMFLKYEGTEVEEYWRFSLGNWIDYLRYRIS